MCTQVNTGAAPNRERSERALIECALTTNTSKSFLALATIITVFAGSAQAFELEDSASSVENTKRSALLSDTPSSAMADSCLPLLKSIDQTNSVSAMDRNQRSAGKAAALGVVFGVRFALGPKEIAKSRYGKPRLDLWQTAGSISDDTRHALAVSGYRACQKEKALNALSHFRWER